MEMMLNKKQNWVIFLLEFKMGHKEEETTCNMNNAFGPGIANKYREGNGTPLQYFCLENPMDGGAW